MFTVLSLHASRNYRTDFSFDEGQMACGPLVQMDDFSEYAAPAVVNGVH